MTKPRTPKADEHPAVPELPAALRSIEVLQLVAQMPGQLSLTDLSTLMRLSKSTVHRLVEQLSKAGYLFREGRPAQSVDRAPAA
jgi:DNA-binding MarR family transcriptional regulator